MMDVVLLTLTTLSLAAAAGFGALSWRVGREERERARARIAALSSAMGSSTPQTPLLGGVAVGSVFDRTTEGLRGRPTIKVAAGAVMLLLIAGGVFISSRTSDSALASTKSQSGGAGPLELMSMRHQRQGTMLTVSGLVKNPRNGAAVHGVTAVVFAFDRSGAFVASGRAPLDFSALAPGDESPFLVNVANVSDVARYRVTFRSGDTVVRHIDHRSGHVQLAQAVR
jgi:hypothetical protein